MKEVTSLDLFQEYTRIDVSDLFDSEKRNAAERRLWSLDLTDLADAVDDLEEHRAAPIYDPEELVPRLWPWSTVTAGFEYEVTGFDEDEVLSNLLYAHHVEIPDLLCTNIPRGKPCNLEYQYPWFLPSLGTMYKISPLVDSGVVTIGPWEGHVPWESQVDSSRALRSARGRAAFLAFSYFSDDHRRAAQRQLDTLVGHPGEDLIGSDSDSAHLTQCRIDAIDQVTDGHARWLMGLNFAQMQKSLAHSHGDMYLPDRTWFEIFIAASDKSPDWDPVLTWTQSFRVPDFREAPIRDLISLRLNSDAFEGWRNAVAAAHKEFESKVSSGNESLARAAAAEVFHGTVEQLRQKLRRESIGTFSGALRSFTIGMIGATPGLISKPSEAIGIAAAGGASGVTADIGWKLFSRRKGRRASDILMRHAVLFENSLADDSTM